MATTMIAHIEAPVSREHYVLGVVLSSGFRIHSDGWLYPQGDEPALARVTVHNGRYMIERRRTPDAIWMQIVTASVGDFDQDAFESWASSWPLTT